MVKIGLLAYWKDYDRKTTLRAVRMADKLGFDSFWVPEAWGYDATTLIAEMAVRTKRIKLGTGIMNVFSRSPALIAQQSATLQEISGGRFMLGLGVSGKNVIEGFHGRPFTKTLSQTKDVIRVVRTLHAGDKLHRAGTTLQDYRPFELNMKPPDPPVPIYVAALKRKAITNIGAMGDGWMPIMWPYDRMAEPRSWIAEGAASAGRDPSEIVTAPFVIVIPLAEKKATDKAREVLSFYIGGMGEYYKQLLSGFGWADECEEISALYADKKTRPQARAAVTDEMIEGLTITGDVLYCRRELRRRMDLGLGQPLVALPPGMPFPAIAAFMTALAPTRWP